MVQAEGKFLRQHQRKGYIARVSVEVAENTSLPSNNVLFAETALLGHYEDWKQGAGLGVQYALRVAGQAHRQVTIVSIIGTDADTNPTIVGAAAIDGIWQSIGYKPSPSEVERIEQVVLGSWQSSPNALPDFERNADA